MTNKLRRRAVLLVITSILLNICPLVCYVVKAFMQSNVVREQIALSLILTIVLILSLIAYFNKIVIKSRLWILLIGLYMVLDYILTPLIIIACCQIIDELLISPIKSCTVHRLQINKEIDKRL